MKRAHDPQHGPEHPWRHGLGAQPDRKFVPLSEKLRQMREQKVRPNKISEIDHGGALVTVRSQSQDKSASEWKRSSSDMGVGRPTEAHKTQGGDANEKVKQRKPDVSSRPATRVTLRSPGGNRSGTPKKRRKFKRTR